MSRLRAHRAPGKRCFLDEVADLPKSAQAALLRVLQEGEVIPVGSARPTKVDIRVLVATHEPLAALVDRGVLREDLRGRLEGSTHELVPLVERRVDLGVLVAALLRKLCPSGSQAVTLAPRLGTSSAPTIGR